MPLDVDWTFCHGVIRPLSRSMTCPISELAASLYHLVAGQAAWANDLLWVAGPT
jgi:hypothetical protein